MLMLDRVEAYDEQSVSASYLIPDAAWYMETDGTMPAWVGLELMAQAVAAHCTLVSGAPGAKPKMGVLLGTRAYECRGSRFASHEVLNVTARIAYVESGGLGAYDCAIERGEEVLATATLKVFEPSDFDAFIKDAAA